MSSKTENTIYIDFSDFVSTRPTAPAPTLSARVQETHRSMVTTDKLLVGLKLLLIHAITSTLSLAVCHQFDMNPFNSTISLADYFMQFGHSTCMFFCGFLFIGLSLTMARLLLNIYDFALLKRTFILQFLGLSTLSLGVFMILGAHTTLTMSLIWLLGGFIGSGLSAFVPAQGAAIGQ